MTRTNPTPKTVVTGNCHWEHETDHEGYRMAYLVDEAGVAWQTICMDNPPDVWAGSLQRHETMGDSF